VVDNGGIVRVMGVWWLKTVDGVEVVADPLRVFLEQLAVTLAPLYLYPWQFPDVFPSLTCYDHLHWILSSLAVSACMRR